MNNDETRQQWESRALDWVRNERIIDTTFEPFTRALLQAVDLEGAGRVLDVGCGAGTLLEAAVAQGVEAVGVDLCEPMVEASRRRAPAATILTADAQTADILALAGGEPFDRVMSRFGVMFFDDPVAAFANIAKATAADGRMAFVAWREGESDLFSVGLEVLLDAMQTRPPLPAENTPGPLGLADGNRIRELLSTAGWTEIEVEPVDGVCDYSVDGSDGVDERIAVALAGGLGAAVRAELESRLGADGWNSLLEEARVDLRRRFPHGPVSFETHVWLVTATRAG